MKFSLMGLRGLMEFIEQVDAYVIRCAACEWRLAILGIPKDEAERAAVGHSCSGRRWRGYEGYTIRPYLVAAGRRT